MESELERLVRDQTGMVARRQLNAFGIDADRVRAQVEWVDVLRPLRRAKPFKRTLSFVDAGAHSGVELEVDRMCRRFAMPQPSRQTRRRDLWARPRWTDAEWALPDGHTVVLEVDGGFHMEVREAMADARRSRRLTTRTRTVVRCTAFELIHELERSRST